MQYLDTVRRKAMLYFVKLWIICNILFILCTKAQYESTLKCIGESFTDELCTGPDYIEVQSAVYGTTSSSDPSACNRNDKTCWQRVKQVNPAYYNEILVECNGNQDCSGLPPVVYETIPDCSYDQSHYVEIFYKCIDVTTTTYTTTTSNSTDEDDPGGGGDGLSGGAIAGIVIGVLLGIGLIALIVILVVLCRINPDFASQAKTTVMKPFYMITREKKDSKSDSSSYTTGDVSPDILRHHNVNGYNKGKPKIKHQNEKMNRATTCRSGFGPEIILTPQDAGANPPHVVTMDTLHTPKPSIEIVSTPQEAIRRTRNTLPYSPDKGGPDEENRYEEFDDDYYDEFNDQYEEYAEISDFEKSGTSIKKKKPSIKPKPKVNQNQTKPKPQEQSLSEEIMNHLKRKKELQNTSGNDTARSSTIEMTENDDLYYNAGDEDYEQAAKVDDKYAENDDDNGSKYYELHPNNKQMSRKYEQLRYSQDNQNGSDNDRRQGYPDNPRHRKSQDIYDDEGEYYDDDDWSTEGSTDDYMGDDAVRTSVLAMQDGHAKGYSRKKSSEC